MTTPLPFSHRMGMKLARVGTFDNKEHKEIMFLPEQEEILSEYSSNLLIGQ